MATRMRRISESRGVDVGYFAAGLVTWRTLRSGRTEYYSSPLMLGRVSLQRREGVDDEELQLVGRATPNETLLRFLKSSYGIDVRPEDLLKAGYMTARFNPSGPVTVLRDIAAKAGATIVIEDRVCVSTFPAASDPVDPSVVSVNHPIIAALLDEFAPVDEDAGASYDLATKVADITGADEPEPDVTDDEDSADDEAFADETVSDEATDDDEAEDVAASEDEAESDAEEDATWETEAKIHAAYPFLFEGTSLISFSLSLFMLVSIFLVFFLSAILDP